jgi:coenzyme F420 hydrogenase subunit beta
MEILGSKELMKQVRDKGLCTVCGACVSICPYHQSHIGKIAMTFDCDITQGQCYAVCPHTDSDMNRLSQMMFQVPYPDKPLGHYLSINSSKTGVKGSEGTHQNGGTVTALISFALDQKWIDSAVLTGSNGLLPEPILANTSKDVAECATTKYMATPTLSLVNKSILNGKKKLGVVGTGCQTKSLATIKANPLDKKEYKDAIALSLGLFCTWALDTRKFLAYLKEKTRPDTIMGMDVPPPPADVLIVKTTNGNIDLPLSEIRTMVQKGCGICPDMTAEWADVSVGSLEGKPGWNTLIVRSSKGKNWVDSAVEAGYLELEEFPAKSLDHLTMGATHKKNRAATAMKEEGI